MQDDGKYASRFSAKPSGRLCAVLPIRLGYVALAFIFVYMYNESRSAKQGGGVQ